MYKIVLSTLVAGVVFIGCGGSSDATDTATSTTTTSGQLIDSYVENVDYRCADGKIGVTDANGGFVCSRLPVAFSMGSLELGAIASISADGQVFPQDILGIAREDVNNSSVVAMARLLQSCDSDANATNGLRIQSELKVRLLLQESFDADALSSYAEDANVTLISQEEAIAHLSDTLETLTALNNIPNLPTTLKTAILSAPATLTQEIKDTLAYMGNEERLAYDVYNYLYAYHGSTINQLNKIATKSESTHIQTVQLLVQKYISNYSEFSIVDRNESGYKDTAIADMIAGSYDIQAIQDLYDALIAKGVQSPRDALEVGCMVEVTDINDLVEDIQKAQDTNASDVVTAFEFLRDGSYNHYWAFDKGLKNMGVSDGCCVLGSTYCHPEYPQTQKGNGNH